MPKKTVTNEKPKNTRIAPAAEVITKPRVAQRVKSVKHSKAAAPAVVLAEIVQAEVAPVNAHEAIAKIAYGYWAARGFQSGSPEQDWLLAEQEYLLQA